MSRRRGPGSDDAVTQVQEAVRGPALRGLARTGFAVSGVLHVIVGWLAVQIAWFRPAQEADQGGALQTVASQPMGATLLWVAVAGCAGLALWQVVEGIEAWRSPGSTGDRGFEAGKASGKAVVYAAIAVTAGRVAVGSGGESAKETADLTARLLDAPGGRVLVGLLGVGVVAVGAYHVHKGITHGFREDLDGRQGAVVDRLGVAGYAAKGVVLGLVGLLFLVAAVRQKPGEATGLDGALRTLREQPYGPVLLTVVAAGLAAFGAYSLARARHARL